MMADFGRGGLLFIYQNCFVHPLIVRVLSAKTNIVEEILSRFYIQIPWEMQVSTWFHLFRWYVCYYPIRMEDRGNVSSMKFSPDRKVLALQRSTKSVVSAAGARHIQQGPYS